MAVFAEKLIQAGIAPASRSIPVSRTSFALTDRNAFDAAVNLGTSWIQRTSAADLPKEAYSGKSFEIEGAKGSASALRLDDELGRIWAAKITFDGDAKVEREWLTELFVEQRAGAFVRFGAQLTCKCAIDDPGFEHSRPRIVRNILDALAGEADSESLSNVFQTVHVDEVDSLANLLYSADRRLPVVLVSVDDEGRAQLDLDRLANRLSGTAHLRCVSIEPSFELSRQIGKRMSTFNGAVRIYMPGLDQESEDPFKHPLWLAPSSGWNPKLTNLLASRILPLGFRDADGEARFWRVGLLRQATSRAAASVQKETQEEQLLAEIEVMRADVAAARESTESAEALMYEEASKLTALQADLSRLEEENRGLRERVRAVGIPGQVASSPITADDLYTVFEQSPTLETSLRIVGSVFPERVTTLPSAYESARDSFVFRHRKKAFDLLWMLCTEYWAALSNGESDMTARRFFGASYAAKESDTLSKAGRRRRTFEYTGENIEMEKHLKVGVADNRTDTLRIHFEWLAAERRIVIGHCGGHLDF